ncbi:peptide deformylase [Cryptosporangium aurantiacum]|uniref:Peptide deformylase n=1 Tax=Cryptosporangium aurantiacum TaxID=134849 RepID=A0A1M7H1M4_9ACTN|nr:peptide deformylase [Cryptosporangium aurantiacum]SHM22069.1 peptide deformylase [Cryptosporangium aurantiacum]
MESVVLPAPGPGGLLPIVVTGQPVLHRPAAPVTVFDAALAELVEQMTASMKAAPGAGLAGPQVGVGLRLFTYDCGPGQRGHVVNPVLERLSTVLEVEAEGCLSIPGLRYPTPRASRVRVTGVDVDGKPVDVVGEGYLARCFQHEVDHLDGVLYVERLGGKVRKQALKDIRAASWNGTPSLEPSRTS